MRTGGFNMTYDFSKFPKITINVARLQSAADISPIFGHHRIDDYVYCIMFKGIVIKFGMSAAESVSRIWGDRLYRQVAHCNTWGNGIRIDGSSGADWLVIERDFKNLYGTDLDHRFLKLIVWDVTHYEFKTFNPHKEVVEMESQLINDYLVQFGEKPIGNIHDDANRRKKAFTEKSLLNRIFDNAEEVFGSKPAANSRRRQPSKIYDKIIISKSLTQPPAQL